MTSRAVLLPHPADPFLFKYWLHFFNDVWGQEVDKLYIMINSPIEKSVIDYMMDLVKDNPKIVVKYLGYQIEHGQAIDELLSEVAEEYVMLIEDDGFIFKSGIVDKYFKMIENNEVDVVGSARGSCSMEIYERARAYFSLSYEGYGDHGCSFWPNFFFIRKGHLLQTDRRFGARNWVRGEKIEALGNYVVQDENCPSDTFVNTSLQLRAMGLRIFEMPQYHASPDDLEHYERRTNLFDGQASWTHIGSLSSGVHGILTDPEGRCLARRLIDEPKADPRVQAVCNTEQEKNEWERRVVAWSLFLDYYNTNTSVEDEGEGMQTFRLLYTDAINKIIDQLVLRRERIILWKQAYHTLGM